MKKITQLFIIYLIITGFAGAAQANNLIILPNQGISPILSQLESAQKSIDLVFYELTDPEIIKNLLQAHKRNINIKIILDNYPNNQNTYQKLKSAGINIHWANPIYPYTHQKTIIIDHKKAIIGTFNLTPSDFKSSLGFGLIIHNKKNIHNILKIFNADWNNKSITPKPSNLVWSPGSTNQLVKLINQSEHQINIFALEINDKNIITSLITKLKQKIKIHLIMTPFPYHGQDHNAYYQAMLVNHGAKIRFITKPYIHAKILLSDPNQQNNLFYLGSANLSYTSLTQNRELGIIKQNSKNITIINKIFNQLWLNPPNTTIEKLASYKGLRGNWKFRANWIGDYYPDNNFNTNYRVIFSLPGLCFLNSKITINSIDLENSKSTFIIDKHGVLTATDQNPKNAIVNINYGKLVVDGLLKTKALWIENGGKLSGHGRVNLYSGVLNNFGGEIALYNHDKLVINGNIVFAPDVYKKISHPAVLYINGPTYGSQIKALGTVNLSGKLIIKPYAKLSKKPWVIIKANKLIGHFDQTQLPKDTRLIKKNNRLELVQRTGFGF